MVNRVPPKTPTPFTWMQQRAPKTEARQRTGGRCAVLAVADAWAGSGWRIAPLALVPAARPLAAGVAGHVPLVWLIRQPELAGGRPYQAIWLAGFVHWLLMLYGISMAHPALIAGWVALSWYLAFYVPIFIWLARVAVHRLGVSRSWPRRSCGWGWS